MGYVLWKDVDAKIFEAHFLEKILEVSNGNVRRYHYQVGGLIE